MSLTDNPPSDDTRRVYDTLIKAAAFAVVQAQELDPEEQVTTFPTTSTHPVVVRRWEVHLDEVRACLGVVFEANIHLIEHMKNVWDEVNAYDKAVASGTDAAQPDNGSV